MSSSLHPSVIKMTDYKIKDIGLAEEGRLLIEYAEKHMPVLMHLRSKHSEKKPLKGMRISGCLHVTKETAVLVETLRAAGADVAWSGCNPLSTNDKVAAALAANDIPIFTPVFIILSLSQVSVLLLPPKQRLRALRSSPLPWKQSDLRRPPRLVRQKFPER